LGKLEDDAERYIMIIVKLKGGLGNQMFQYAAGKALALRNKTELKFDLSWFEKQIDNIPRAYELGIFPFKQNFVDTETLRNMFWFMNQVIFTKIIRNILSKILPYRIQKMRVERHFQFDREVFLARGNIYLDGYWQSEKYFLDAKKDILCDFTFPLFVDVQNQKVSHMIQNTHSVSVHVRRSDYISLANVSAHLGGICTLDYYQKALSLILEKVPDAEFFFFSDDIEWVKENLGKELKSYYIDWNKDMKSYRDIQLMSLCQHNIIANSSFSWWGAWLNQNPNKIVIAPDKWFNDTNIDTRDLLPDSWIRIQTNDRAKMVNKIK